MNLTYEERRIAINQLTSLDVTYATIGAMKGKTTYQVVPIPPNSHGEPDRWVAVEPLSEDIRTDIRQPNPEKVVLCASVNDCGCTYYCYGDKISCYIISSIILTAIFSVITTPLLLLCCVPMIKNLIKVRLSLHYYL
jgi:hypothetical protein